MLLTRPRRNLNKEGEVIVFTDHMSRGLAPPGSKFFRDVLHFFDLRPQDIGPNSVSNICNFQVFCEVYLGEEPNILLFKALFYLNRQNERANGPSLELGGISIQWRRDYLFPYARRTLLRLRKILCPASAPCALSPTIRWRIS